MSEFTDFLVSEMPAVLDAAGIKRRPSCGKVLKLDSKYSLVEMVCNHADGNIYSYAPQFANPEVWHINIRGRDDYIHAISKCGIVVDCQSR